MNLHERLLQLILGCCIGDVDYLFSNMDSDLLADAIEEIHNNDIEMSAENLWTECIQLAAERIFKTQSDFIETVFNCIDSHVGIVKKHIQYIEDFEEKKDKLEELTNETLEIWEV